ncbi:MAG: phosphotransferase [Cycloclasticus sp.]
MGTDRRKQLLLEWLRGVFGTDEFSCEAASVDASFRRYFRLVLRGESYVVMDAPPDKEDCQPFIAIANVLFQQGINTPVVFHQSLELGFLVLTDLGSRCYLDELKPETAPALYTDAVQALHKMHQLVPAELEIPVYDAALLQQEMDLFNDWFLVELLGIQLSAGELEGLALIQQKLLESALAQPQVFVHRDYHSRNLMCCELGNPGVIDFQDAVLGPLSYDLASLYRDCYIEWPDEQVHAWLDDFLQQRQQMGCDDEFGSACFYQWFDWMGMQRHMKAIGIFCRLLLRDGKAGYLKDIPRTLSYVLKVAQAYDELKPLADLLLSHAVEAKFDQHLRGLS